MFEVWAEKYRPKTLNEIINQKHVVERLKAFAKDKNIPHCLFSGRAGVGKTASALALAHDLFGDKWKQNVLELNASDERGIDIIRNKVKDFARTKSIDSEFKIIILDEADALTRDAQQALRRTMENFTQTARFILICNYSSKIIEPIQSRCSVFRFKSLSDDHVRKYIERIAKGENLAITKDGIDAIIEISEGDLRKVSNILQASSIANKKINADVVYEVASQAKPKDVSEMLNFAINGNFNNARKKLHELLLIQGLSGEDIIKEIHKQIFSLNIPEQEKVRLIDKTGEYDFRITEGGSALIQLEALLAQFLDVKK